MKMKKKGGKEDTRSSRVYNIFSRQSGLGIITKPHKGRPSGISRRVYLVRRPTLWGNG